MINMITSSVLIVIVMENLVNEDCILSFIRSMVTNISLAWCTLQVILAFHTWILI